MSNVIRFPKNIFDPTPFVLNNYEYKLYRANFRSISDLYQYLKSNPDINSSVFPRLASEREDSDFAGEPYEAAVESLVKPVKAEFKDFLKLQSKLDSQSLDYVTEYVTTKSAAGSVIDIPSYVSGSPLCYISEKEVSQHRKTAVQPYSITSILSKPVSLKIFQTSSLVFLTTIFPCSYMIFWAFNITLSPAEDV